MTLTVQKPASQVFQNFSIITGSEAAAGSFLPEKRTLSEIDQILAEAKAKLENLRKSIIFPRKRHSLTETLSPQSEEKTEVEPVISKNNFLSGKGIVKSVSSTIFSINGTTSTVLRYPHLIAYLSYIREKKGKDDNLNILILGPGLDDCKMDEKRHLSSSQTHEILAAFSPKVKVTIVDIAEFVNRLKNSVFGEAQKRRFSKVLSLCDGYNIALLTPDQKKRVQNYMQNIPEKILQELKLVQQDFAEFVADEKYDYIFAMLSLKYSLKKVQNCKKASLDIINKYFSYLKSDGCFFVDESLYQLMRKNIAELPNPEALLDGPLKYSYLKTSYEATRLLVPNSSREIVKIPLVLYKDDEGTNLWTTTSEIYCIKRLPSCTKRSAITAEPINSYSKRQKDMLP